MIDVHGRTPSAGIARSSDHAFAVFRDLCGMMQKRPRSDEYIRPDFGVLSRVVAPTGFIMNTSCSTPMRIMTHLHVAERLILDWANKLYVRHPLVIYHPEDSIRRKLVALVEKWHTVAEVQAISKLTLPQFLRAICEASRLPAARTAYDCFERVCQKGTPFHITDAHLLRPDHLSVVIDFAEGHNHRVVLSSTHRDVVSLIQDSGHHNEPHWSKFHFPNAAGL